MKEAGRSLVWLNGRFVERAEARVGAFDAGVQHGVGVFETMIGVGGRVFRLAEHMGRLERSARELGLSESLNTRALGEAVETVVAKSGLAEGEARARIRLTVTGGDLNLLRGEGGGGGGGDPTVLIDVQPAQQYPEAMFEQGIGVVVAETKANPLNAHEGHKTLNYWWRLRELQRAAASGAGEALVLQVTNHACGGCVSNVFGVKDGTLMTPIARGEEGGAKGAEGRSPVLPGITRGAVMEFGEKRGMGCARPMIAVGDLLDADEVFLTNSSWGVLPVTRVEAHTIADGSVGEATRVLRAAWLEALAEEI